MYDVVVMHEIYPMADLLGNDSGLFLVKSTFSFQLSEEVTSCTILQDQVKMFLVVEERVKLSYVRVL